MPDVHSSRDLVEFSFTSRTAPCVPASALLRLARQSWSYNKKMHITGFLRLENDGFYAHIEGPCSVLRPLAARIISDGRHDTIRISTFSAAGARRHAAWSTFGFDAIPDPVAPERTGDATASVFRPVQGPLLRRCAQG